ncbi:RDD family protein [Pontibacter arcticus]|uniref:RDD family protein n=1 Tax=Pontibacter arcticus TaxID=2080288 RepID=A0A364REK2_9BACT|nr:RDD family protein [Pontibacter arcticus]RAU82741.1 RDD family protein [Pontibacter arcticus]
MQTIKIRTTQNVEVEYPMASVGDRIVAQLIDYAVYFVWMILVVIILQGIGANDDIMFFLILMLPIVFYHLICEIFFNGQSIGKRARDIQVIKLSGQAPTVGDYLLRWLFRLVDTALTSGVVAIVTIASTKHGQRLGDMAAGTCVIKQRVIRVKDRIQVILEPDYQIRFPEVSALTDSDVALIRKLLFKAQQHNNYTLLEKVAIRVKETTGIISDMDEWPFLQTIVKDYHHYTHGDVIV